MTTPPRQTLRLLLFCLAILVGPVLLGPGLFPKKKFDNKLQNKVVEENPDYVFIGDSMLLTRLDPAHLSNLTGGARVTVLAGHGLSSAGWYLMLKNFVAATGVKPKMVFVIFRDYALSWPHYRTTGSYREKMEPFMQEDEPVLKQVWENTPRSAKARVEGLLEKIYPLQKRGTEAEDMLRIAALTLSPRVWSRRERLLEEVNDVFELDNLRKDVPGELADSDSPALENFDSSREATFVPHLLDEAEKHGLKVCFYRVKRRPPKRSEYREDMPGMQSYMHSLRTYAESRGMLFYDANKDPREHAGMFADGDHIAEEHRSAWTEIFYDQLREVFE